MPVEAPDFVSTHSYPTDECNAKPDSRTKLDCFTDGIITARQQAVGKTFLLTEFNCGWRNTAIHDGESHAYAASFMFRTVNALMPHEMSALSWWTFSSIFEEGALSHHLLRCSALLHSYSLVHSSAVQVLSPRTSSARSVPTQPCRPRMASRYRSTAASNCWRPQVMRCSPSRGSTSPGR